MPSVSKPKYKPEWNNNEDALGGDNSKYSSLYEHEAKYFATVQRVKGVGRRPIDWMKRDLLATATGDDRRCWAYRKILKNTASFLIQSYDNLPGINEPSRACFNTIRQARAFDYLNRCHLLEMRDKMEEYSFQQRVATASVFCPTSLYETCTLIPHNDLKYIRISNVCNNPWNCPHCYARSMSANYLLAQRKIMEQDIAFVALLSDDCLIDLDEQEECKRRRNNMRKSLLDTAKAMGGTGGLWTVQIGPILEQKSYWAQNEVQYEHVQLLNLRVAVLAGFPQNISSLKRLRPYLSGNQSFPPGISVDAFSTSTQGHLRALIIKGSNASTTNVKINNNDYGLFYWPPVTICSSSQWESRFLMTRHKKSVRTWGNWTNSSRQISTESPEPACISKQSIHERRQRLKAMASPVLVNYGWPGKPYPGRRVLRELLITSEIDVSERDVRWLISTQNSKERNLNES